MKTTLIVTILFIAHISYAQVSTVDKKLKINSKGISNKTDGNNKKEDQVFSTWEDFNEKDECHGFIKIPKDANPGYVKVSLTQSDGDLKPAMVISRDLRKAGAIISGSSVKTNDESSRTAFFSVHPGMTYSVKVYPFVNAKSYSPPVQYTLKWQFIGKEDKYEPNDTRNQAKQVSFNQPIEAYAIVGYIKQYYIGTYDENTYDWYKVNLDDYKKISVKVLNRPNDLELNIRVINAAGRQVGTVITRDYTNSFNSAQNGKSSKVVTTRNNLAKGTYYLEVHPRMKGERKANNDTKPVPEHFNKPYKLIVTKK